MPSNCEYYLYQKFIKYGTQDFIPVYPVEYAISGDTGQNPVVKRCESPNCGFCEPEYRWHTLPIGEEYICSGGNKYFIEYYQVSNDCGFNWENTESARTGSLYESGSSDCIEYRWVNMDISTDWVCSGTSKYYKQKKQWKYTDSSTWADVVPPEYQMGALYESASTDCGYIPPQYRWVVTSGYACSGTNKMTKEIEQVSYDSGTTWQNVVPEVSRAALPMIESASTDCGYVKFKAAYSDSTEYVIYCNSSTTLNQTEVRGHSTPYSSMTDAEIGDCVTNINGHTFESCSFTSCTISSGVTSIGEYSFFNCGNLVSIIIPNNVTSIGNTVFAYCSGLTSCVLSNSITSVGDSSFLYCTSLLSISIPNGVTSIGKQAFEFCSGLTSCTLGNSVASIGNEAFFKCSGLTSISIPNGVTSIGKQAFEYCSSLSSCTIGSGVIDDLAFAYCSGLTSCTLGDGVTSFGRYAFANCSSLTSCTIGSGITLIGPQSFEGTSLIEITVNATTPPTLGAGAFNGISTLSAIYVPAASVNAYKTAYRWSDYASIIQAIP